MRHLLVDVSAHGYGHLAQTAPVVNALAQRLPGLRITVRSAAPLQLLRQRFSCDFTHVPLALDFGMQMVDAVKVDVPGSMAAYRACHADWSVQVARAAAEMRAIAPDLLLANVPYLSLAAAQQAGIPAVAMCCLNWADIYRHYAVEDAASRAIHAQMLDAYASAVCFLKVQPSMPMPDLTNAREIAPIAQLGQRRRDEIDRRIPSAKAGKYVLVGMGGIGYSLTLQSWPRQPGVHWLVPASSAIQRDDVSAIESLGMSFSDVLASCDAVLTKPGYGTFAEAACAGVPVLYLSRGDWPEQPCLVEWLQRHGVCREVTAAQVQRGELASSLQWLWSQPKPHLPVAAGAAQAAEVLAGLLQAA